MRFVRMFAKKNQRTKLRDGQIFKLQRALYVEVKVAQFRMTN